MRLKSVLALARSLKHPEIFSCYSVGIDNKSAINENGMVLIGGREYRPWYENLPLEKGMSANELGFGLFGWVNSFEGNIRKKENLKKVNFWYSDVDGLSSDSKKNEFLLKLKSVGLPPSITVESKNGFHLYWRAALGIRPDPDRYEKIVRGINQTLRIESVFDCTRVLRVPGSIHSKDPLDVFVVTAIKVTEASYSEDVMEDCFPYVAYRPAKIGPDRGGTPTGGDFFSELETKSQAVYLEKLSGSSHVSGEVYTFKQSARGHMNILVNGKSTGAFVDERGMLGSHGQPVYTVAHWLMNTGNFHSWKEVIEVIKSLG